MSAQQVTVGRRVYYWPTNEELEGWDIKYVDSGQPWDAGVLFVHADGTINVQVTDYFGEVMTLEECVFTGTAEKKQGACSWMPYQAAQQREQAAQVPNKA